MCNSPNGRTDTLETSLFFTYRSETTEDLAGSVAVLLSSAWFLQFFRTDPQCIHHTMSKNFGHSITSCISSELSKLISPDFSLVKRWVERSLSLVGRYAAALAVNWLCTLLVIDLETKRSRQWLQGKAQLSLLEALLGKLPKVSFYSVDICYE